MNFKVLVKNIKVASDTLNRSATKAVNVHLTIRNLLVGYYIVEFEQEGKDRAEYGKKLLQNLAKEINIKGLTAPELSRCRQFYNVYFPILGSVTQKLKNEQNSILSLPPHELENLPMQILGTVSQESKNEKAPILGTLSQELQINENELYTSHYKELFLKTSYSILSEIIKIEENTKRNFYELLVIKTQPSFRELKRQINSLAYERLGLSKDKDLAFEQLKKKIEPATSTDLVKSHYFFEFLEISKPELIEETELEQALISNLQEFILELGNAYVKIREFQKAIDYFMKAIELYTAPFYQKANQNMIAAYLDLGDYKKVIELAHEFLQNSPNHEIVVEMKEKAEKILKGEKSNDKLDERPTLFIVSGGICSGKSTHIANEYPSNYLHIDAGDLFIGLSEGEYYDFPSELEEPLNEFGFELFKMGIRTKRDIVIEVVGSDIAIMEQFFDLAKSIKYRVKVDHITCDIETAKHRNNNRGDDSISSYYTEQFHLNWFRQAVVEYLSN